MNYTETINFLFEKLPMYQRQGAVAYKKDLTNIILLCDALGNPQTKFKSIHIAGTNGKGSVSHILAAVLQTAGYKTGLYTSPHLKDFRERIKINGEMIDEISVIDFVKDNISLIEKINPSFFEITVALAFYHFHKKNVDFAIIETGLGGRLDSTNIITPHLSVITNISYDHTAMLGNTLEQIAFEKAGIIKKNVPIVIGETTNKTRSVFIEAATMKNAPIYLADYNLSAEYSFHTQDFKQVFNINKGGEIYYASLKTDLGGLYQKKNIVTALQAIDILKDAYNLSKENIYDAILNVCQITGLRGRWEILSTEPTCICDTGHNEDGIKEIVKQIQLVDYKKLHFVYGTVNDKDIETILTLLPKDAIYYFTKAQIPRALDENILQKKASQFNLAGNSYATVAEAIADAKKNAAKDDLIFIGGSTFIVAEAI